MLQTLNPYAPTAKTAEIMARYRPIAPKPQASNAAGTGCGGGSSGGGGGDEGSGSGATSGSGSCTSPSSMSPTIRQSPYLRNVWPHLQSRPTRTRKRGRTSLGPPPSPSSFKRPRTLLQGLSPPFHITASPGCSRTRTLSVQGFAPTTTLVTLPLLPTHPMQLQQADVIDLNKTADQIPEEKDFIAQLQKQPSTNVISPTPNRLIPSTVSIRGIKLDDTFSLDNHITLKKPEEIENELESQPLPAFVSDSNNQVRLVNSSYQEMVGQPDCGWVQSMVAGDQVACRSICGKVALNFGESDDEEVRVCSGGFSCWARIEWGVDGKKKNLVNAFGEGMRLACESKDYKFAWRFHRRQAGADDHVLQN